MMVHQEFQSKETFNIPVDMLNKFKGTKRKIQVVKTQEEKEKMKKMRWKSLK